VPLLTAGNHVNCHPSHHITSHGENGSRPQRPLYPRNNDKVHFILHKILYYNTTVSDAMEICFVIIQFQFTDQIVVGALFVVSSDPSFSSMFFCVFDAAS